jgi:quinol monooxygenase YgiN
MINIIAKNYIAEGKADEFKALAKPLIAASREEEGCVSYSLFEDIHDKNILTFIEEWKSIEAIQIHNNSPHFTSIVPTLGPLTAKPSDVNLYEVVE